METIPFKQVTYSNMRLILNFVYYGEVDVPLTDVASLMETAQLLQISALTQALLKFSDKIPINEYLERSVGNSGTIMKNDECNLSVQENSVVWNYNVLPEREQGSNTTCLNNYFQPVIAFETEAGNVLCEVLANVNEDDSKDNILNSQMGEATVYKNPEEFENEVKPITFVVISPVSVRSDECDKEVALSVSDPLLTNTLEEHLFNCESTKVLYANGESNCGSVCKKEIKIKQGTDVCDSETVLFSGEIKQSCDELTMPVEGNVPNYSECVDGRHIKRHLSLDQTVTSVKTEGCILRRAEECEVKFQLVCDVSDSEVKEKKQFLKCLDVENHSHFGKGEIEILKCEALESSVIKYVNQPPNQVEAGKDSSVSNLICCSWKIQRNHIEKEEDNTITCGEEQESVNCTQCDANIVSKAMCNLNLASHSRDTENLSQSNLPSENHCAKLIKSQITFKNTIKKQKPNTKEKPFECVTCNASFSRKGDLERHMRIHTGIKPFQCVTCNATFSLKYQMERHTRTHTGIKPFKCGICNASFSFKHQLKRHTGTHTGIKPFKCGTCNASFSFKHEVERHTRIHSEIKPFECGICKKLFRDKSHLKTHMLVHTRVKPFECGHCQKLFSQNSNLKAHMLKHTGIKAFECGTCNASFSFKSLLARHTQIHTGIKPFKCGTCKKLFSQNCNLKTHMLEHTGNKPFECGICNATFSHKSDLERHTRIHTGVKPFECGTCNASFCHKSDLERHTRIHTRAKPFECGTCKKLFSEKRYLKNHMLKHT